MVHKVIGCDFAPNSPTRRNAPHKTLEAGPSLFIFSKHQIDALVALQECLFMFIPRFAPKHMKTEE
jgi:hypothetical protein